MATPLGERDGTIRPGEIKRALEEILASEYFAGSSQLADFLTFIVAKTLAGEAGDIKAYTIAVDGLGRSEDFDPQTNATVRVAAGRLRQALNLYNAERSITPGTVTITLAPGSYVPSFSRSEERSGGVKSEEAMPADRLNFDQSDPSDAAPFPMASSVDADHKIMAKALRSSDETASTNGFFVRRWPVWSAAFALVIVVSASVIFSTIQNRSSPPPSDGLAQANSLTVDARDPAAGKSIADLNVRPKLIATVLLPDAPYPDWFKAGETIASLGVVAARFDDYQFLGVRRRETVPLDDPRVADYHLWITAYQREDTVRLFGQLVREGDGTVLWSTQRLFDRPAKLEERNVPSLMGQAFSPLASPYGVIQSDLLRQGQSRSQLGCIVATYQYFSRESDVAHRRARDCNEALVDAGSLLPTVHAALTFLYLDEYRQGRNRRDADPLDAAERMAKRAVELGPQSARAHQAMFAIHKVRGDRKNAKAAGEKAVALNPYDTDILGDYAAWLISVGELEDGNILLARAAAMLDARPAWFEFYRFLGAELSEDYEAADNIASVMDAKRSPLVALAVALGAHRRGEREKTDAALAALKHSEPSFLQNPMQSLVNRGFDVAVAEKLVSRLAEAGLKGEN